MNCLQLRRELLASPRRRDAEHDTHLALCQACAALVDGIDTLDRRIHEAALVPPPDGLVDRILLKRARAPKWRLAVAAALLGVATVLASVMPDVADLFDFTGTAEVVGPTHPGVAAIALVVDDEARVVDVTGIGAAQQIASSLKRLGLTLDDVSATTYVGKCHMSGGDCDHLLLSTPEGFANVLLLPDHQVVQRVLVADRRMIALVNPAPHGGYIVVAHTQKLAKRTGRLFRRG